MSPDPNPRKMDTCDSNDSVIECGEITANFKTRICQLNDLQQNGEVNNTGSAEYRKCNDTLMKLPTLLTGRERRNISPPSNTFHEVYVDPQSPSSSSSTSQTTNDVTFEPTIEMMVNDFDDEQTLNEEEALASQESQDPDDEINTLKKESEMPLEELLAKYRDLPPLPPSILYLEPIRRKTKKASHKDKHKQKKKLEAPTANKNSEKSCASNKMVDASKNTKASLETFENATLLDENILPNDGNIHNFKEKCSSSTSFLRKPFTSSVNAEYNESNGNPIVHTEISKVRRSHLLDLYPEGTFDNVVNDAIVNNSKDTDIPLETIFGVEDDEDEEIEEEDEDYKKKVMIGTSYQAIIPEGLSQYGDILPYENEDKLIWEPCQVSEREVEEYLIKIRDIKTNLQTEEDEVSTIEIHSENKSKENKNISSENKIDDLENNSFVANGNNLLVETLSSMETDSQAVVKDNEQALHLLVQCGYDFKEALRRKRLNALPLNDCMSLWSEEECHKFEEGIQKYGKDFLKIRQNQVRTRTMRELVQFYYLWKKSERRDHNFANADTVDHMDIYLNEDNEYGSNPSSVITPVGSPDGNTSSYACIGRNNNFSQKSISIMSTPSTVQSATNLTTEKTCLQQHHQQHHKRRTNSSNQTIFNVTTANDFGIENVTNSTK